MTDLTIIGAAMAGAEKHVIGLWVLHDSKAEEWNSTSSLLQDFLKIYTIILLYQTLKSIDNLPRAP